MKNVSAIAALLLLGGCSLINSFADLQQQASDGGGTGGVGGKGGTAGKGSGGAATGGKGGAGGTVPEAGVAGTQNDASTGGEPNTGGSSSGGAGTGGAPDEDVLPPPGGPGGAIVVYQSTKTPAESVVWVLNPATGAELSKTNSPNLAAVLNDPNTDNWYWFETTSPVAVTAQLYVRSLSLPSGRWSTVPGGPYTVPAPTGSVSLLTGGIAYVSSATGAVVILNTADQKKITVFANLNLDAEAAPNAVLDGSTRLGIISHPSAKGGTVTAVLEEPSGNCMPVGLNTLCNIDVLRINVDFTAGPSGATVDTSPPVTVGRVNTAGGNPGFAADNANDADIIILPSEDGSPITKVTACSSPATASQGTVQEFKPNDHTATTAQLPFLMGSTHISSAAFDYCQNIAYATSLLDQVIWGVPTSGSPPPASGQICKSTGGAALIYEPYTRSLLRVANDSSLESYAVTGSAAAPPTFKSNTNFRTPTGFSALSGVIAVRTGSPVSADNPVCAP